MNKTGRHYVVSKGHTEKDKYVMVSVTCGILKTHTHTQTHTQGISVVKKLPAIARHGFDPWVWKTPWKWKWQLIPVFLLGKSHGQSSLRDKSQKSQT